MDPEHNGSARLIACSAFEYALYEALLEFFHRFLKQVSPIHHLADEHFQLVLHGTLQRESLGLRRVSPARSRSGCETLPGTSHVLLQPLRPAVPAQAGFWA